MLQSAIEQQVTERDDLDWKERFPESRNPKAAEEFAKDVAAMVNSGGGMIVFGMAENRVSSAAERIVPIEGWTDATERKLRSWAYSLIQPPVHGLEFTALGGSASGVDSGSLAVVLQIPASPEMPHFVMKGDTIRAPRRYGAQTVYMSERDIERAYRTRFEDRRNSERSLSDLLEQNMLGIDQGGRVWLAAAARPTRPRPAHAGRVSRHDAQEILSSLMHTNPFLKQSRGLEYAGLDPRPGYRKWRSVNSHNGHSYGIVDIHDDGSVSLSHEATPLREQAENAPSADVHVMEAQSLPAHIAQLVLAAAQRFGMAGDFEVCILISPPGIDPIYIRTLETGINALRNRDQLSPIHGFHPVNGLLSANAPVNESLETVRNLALDVMNQAGVGALGSMYLKDQV